MAAEGVYLLTYADGSAGVANVHNGEPAWADIDAPSTQSLRGFLRIDDADSSGWSDAMRSLTTTQQIALIDQMGMGGFPILVSPSGDAVAGSQAGNPEPTTQPSSNAAQTSVGVLISLALVMALTLIMLRRPL